MALVFIDGFDHYTTLTQKWQETSGSPSITSAAGRFGGSGLRQTAQTAWIRRNLGAAYTELISGFAFSTTNYFTRISIAAWYSSGASQVHLVLESTGQLTVRQTSSTGTSLGNSGGYLVPQTGAWQYIEFRVKFGNPTGEAEVRVNGTTVISVTGVNTIPSGSTTANQFLIGTGNDTGTCNWDDLYIIDTTGSSPTNTFLGDMRIDTLFPSGAGNYGDFTRGGTDSGANWSQVDEAAPNDTTDYVYSSTVGNRDSYAFSDLANTSSVVYGAALNMRYQKADAGARTVRGFARHGGVNGAGTTFTPGAGSWEYRQDFININPSTSAAWTPTEINAAEFGLEIVS